MSAMPPPNPPQAPPPQAPPPGSPVRFRAAPPTTPGGSILKGFLLGWAMIVGANFAIGAVLGTMGAGGMLNGSGNELLLSVGVATPWLATIALAVYFGTNDQSRSATGVALALVSAIALIVLLVATCFALLSGANFH